MGQTDRDNSSHWIWGLIYYNQQDSKLIVPKRFGLGWTFNFAHKATWLFLLAVAVIVVVVKLWK